MSPPFSPVVLGRTGLEVGRLGIASSYGIRGAPLEEAVEAGCNYLYWGSIRREGFARSVRRLAGRRRDRLVLALQSYSRSALAMRWSVEIALRRLRLERADVLLLGWWNHPPSRRILDEARELKVRGKIRFLALSTHHRPFAGALAQGDAFDVLHVRYNAAHRGAEDEVFPRLPKGGGPGMVAYTATCWKQLLERPRGLDPSVPIPQAADCYRFALSHPAVHVCMTGPSDALQMREALRALELGPLSKDELEWMRTVGDRVHATRRPRLP